MGKTGSGKSSLLNSLTNTNYFQVGNSIMSETREVKSFRGKFKGRLNSPDILFIDTPGFFDSSSRDNKIIAKIALSLNEIDDGLNLVLFCFPAYEIRLDSSMQASWRFLRLIMGRAVYDHVIIVLTHGSRLKPQELENSVARMTTEFIPYLRNKLKCKVKEETLIYKKGFEDDGLDEVFNYIITNNKYKPEVMKDLYKFWDPKNPLESIESLLKNSKIFHKIQKLLIDVKNKHESLQTQIKEIKQEVKQIKNVKSNEINKKVNKFIWAIDEKLKASKESIETLKDEVKLKIRNMQDQMKERDKQMDILRREIKELKTAKKMQDTLTTRSSIFDIDDNNTLLNERKTDPNAYKGKTSSDKRTNNGYYSSVERFTDPKSKTEARYSVTKSHQTIPSLSRLETDRFINHFTYNLSKPFARNTSESLNSNYIIENDNPFKGTQLSDRISYEKYYMNMPNKINPKKDRKTVHENLNRNNKLLESSVSKPIYETKKQANIQREKVKKPNCRKVAKRIDYKNYSEEQYQRNLRNDYIFKKSN